MKEMPKAPYPRTILICCNEREPGEDACANRGSKELQETLKQCVKDLNLKGKIRVSRALCFGLCAAGPNICIQPDNIWYADVRKEDLPMLIDKWIRPLAD